MNGFFHTLSRLSLSKAIWMRFLECWFALVAGELAGAALDVTDPEPLPADHKLLTLPNVIVTCHTAANSDESYVDCQTHAAREVANVLSGKGPTTEIKDPWLLEEAQDEGFGGV